MRLQASLKTCQHIWESFQKLTQHNSYTIPTTFKFFSEKKQLLKKFPIHFQSPPLMELISLLNHKGKKISIHGWLVDWIHPLWFLSLDTWSKSKECVFVCVCVCVCFGCAHTPVYSRAIDKAREHHQAAIEILWDRAKAQNYMKIVAGSFQEECI